MIPAINRKPIGEATAQVDLKTKLEARTQGKTFTVPKEVLDAAARNTGPELILNPQPSATPQILAPGKCMLGLLGFFVLLFLGFLAMWKGLITTPEDNDSSQSTGWAGWCDYFPKLPPGNRK